MRHAFGLAVAGFALTALASYPAPGQMTANESKAVVGDAPLDPGPLATGLSGEIAPSSIQAAMRKVADWQAARVADSPSQDWTFATLYVGMLSASETLRDSRYRNLVAGVADHYHWTLGPRKSHADDQAIGQVYLWLYRQNPDPQHIEAMRMQFDEIMKAPDDAAKPVWWWCDALFMAPPVWSGLSVALHDPKYLEYMNHEWQITSDLLWDPQEHLFYRDSSYFDKREKNGKKVFWSRGNGWVMGGLVRVLDNMPANDPQRAFYVVRLQAMAQAVAKIQGPDGLWRPGLLDATDYPNPEVSGSAFFVYAITWGLEHHLLDEKEFVPVVRRGWAGLVGHIYKDGRLGCIQPVGAAPGAYTTGASYVFGPGAFLLAGSEVNRWAMLQSGKAVGPRSSSFMQMDRLRAEGTANLEVNVELGKADK
jgi:unsaturated rhamnogalacturonyl hydrolase